MTATIMLAGRGRVAAASVTVTASNGAGPAEARCHACGTTWTPGTNGLGLADWMRCHQCEPNLPPLDDIDEPAVGRLACGLRRIALGLLDRTIATSRTQSELVGAEDQRAFWQAVGRHDGLLEAHRYVLGIVEALQERTPGGDRP